MLEVKIVTDAWNISTLLSQVMPSYVSHGWRVKKSFSQLLPEADAQGERRELSAGKEVEVRQFKIEWTEVLEE